MQLLRLRVQPARRLEVSEIEMTTAILDSAAQHIDHATLPYFARDALEQFLARVIAVMFAELLPCLRLRRVDEIHHVARDETKIDIESRGEPLVITTQRSNCRA